MAGPLPRGWEQQYDDDGTPFFVDHCSEATTYMDPRGAKQNPLPPGWEEQIDSSGFPFYVDHNLQRTSYMDPRIYEPEEIAMLSGQDAEYGDAAEEEEEAVVGTAEAPQPSDRVHGDLAWYFPECSRQDAEAKLQACTGKVFLVRNSSRAGAYALSKFNSSTRELDHFIIGDKNGKWLLEDSETGDTTEYATIRDLVTKSADLEGYRGVGAAAPTSAPVTAPGVASTPGRVQPSFPMGGPPPVRAGGTMPTAPFRPGQPLVGRLGPPPITRGPVVPVRSLPSPAGAGFGGAAPAGFGTSGGSPGFAGNGGPPGFGANGGPATTFNATGNMGPPGMGGYNSNPQSLGGAGAGASGSGNVVTAPEPQTQPWSQTSTPTLLTTNKQVVAEYFCAGKFGIKGWNKRLLSLEPSGELRAYKKSIAETPPQQTWQLSLAKEAKVMATTFKGRKFVWKLVVGDLEMYYFSAESPQEASTWAQEVNATIGKARASGL